ncbi:MAG: sigma 54-interacting transcriptional regulator [Bacteroidales bacterium]|nr:sigma 54-interacting transcriptional regulator [Bacteroidales bacterium]
MKGTIKTSNGSIYMKSLLESETMFQNLLDYIPGVSIQGYMADGIVRYWNKASEEVYGYTAEEAIGRNLEDLIIPPEIKPNFKQALELGAKGTKSGEFIPPGELMLLHKNGSLVPVYSIHTAVCLDGDPPLMFCIDVDLSERKRIEEALRKVHKELERRVEERTAELANVNDKLKREIEEHRLVEESLRESEKRYSLATTAGCVGVWDWNLETNEIYIDPMLKTILGYEDHEIRNHIDDWGKRVYPADRERVMAEATKHLENASPHYEIEHRMLHKDGSIRWFLARGTAMRDKTGNPYRMLGTDMDITKHMRIDEELKRSETRLTEAQHAAHLGGWEWNIVKHEVHWSTELYRILDVDPDEFKPSKDTFIKRVHPDDRCYLEECMSATLSNKKPFSVDHRIILPSGTIRFLHSEIRMECDASNKPVRLLGIAQDITERKRAEEVLRKSYAEIKQLKDRLKAESDYLKKEVKITHSHYEIVGESEAIKKVLRQIEQVATTESLVLITGKTGTGKELVVRKIHNLSKCKDRIMVKVDCASLPSTLIESELFGRQKGAYTGALTSQVGRFEVADGSTIFLDEIGELSMELQAKLLRVLQDGEFERLGSPKTIRINTRVIAATNLDLYEEMRKGNFREDLYYRLNVFHIEVPPLLERLDDIPLLVCTFVNEFAEKMGKQIQTVPGRTMEALQRYHWPGNIRELRNVIEHAVIISTGNTLEVHLPKNPKGVTSRISTLEDAERQHIIKVLDRTNWCIKGPHGAAELLGLNPSTLYTKMNKLGIPTSRNKDAIPT